MNECEKKRQRKRKREKMKHSENNQSDSVLACCLVQYLVVWCVCVCVYHEFKLYYSGNSVLSVFLQTSIICRWLYRILLFLISTRSYILLLVRSAPLFRFSLLLFLFLSSPSLFLSRFRSISFCLSLCMHIIISLAIQV